MLLPSTGTTWRFSIARPARFTCSTFPRASSRGSFRRLPAPSGSSAHRREARRRRHVLRRDCVSCARRVSTGAMDLLSESCRCRSRHCCRCQDRSLPPLGRATSILFASGRYGGDTGVFGVSSVVGSIITPSPAGSMAMSRSSPSFWMASNWMTLSVSDSLSSRLASA